MPPHDSIRFTRLDSDLSCNSTDSIRHSTRFDSIRFDSFDSTNSTFNKNDDYNSYQEPGITWHTSEHGKCVATLSRKNETTISLFDQHARAVRIFYLISTRTKNNVYLGNTYCSTNKMRVGSCRQYKIKNSSPIYKILFEVK